MYDKVKVTTTFTFSSILQRNHWDQFSQPSVSIQPADKDVLQVDNGDADEEEVDEQGASSSSYSTCQVPRQHGWTNYLIFFFSFWINLAYPGAATWGGGGPAGELVCFAQLCWTRWSMSGGGMEWWKVIRSKSLETFLIKLTNSQLTFAGGSLKEAGARLAEEEEDKSTSTPSSWCQKYFSSIEHRGDRPWGG